MKKVFGECFAAAGFSVLAALVLAGVFFLLSGDRPVTAAMRLAAAPAAVAVEEVPYGNS